MKKPFAGLFALTFVLFLKAQVAVGQGKLPAVKNIFETIKAEPSKGLWNFKKTETLRINVVEMKGVTKMHKHPDAEHTILLIKGNMLAEIDGNKIPLQEGDMISIPAGMPHKYKVKGKKAIIVSMDAPYYDPKKTVMLE